MKDANFPSLPCMAHTLQLAVSQGVLSENSITDMTASGRHSVSHFKHSQLAYLNITHTHTQNDMKKTLQNIQKQLGQSVKWPQQVYPPDGTAIFICDRVCWNRPHLHIELTVTCLLCKAS